MGLRIIICIKSVVKHAPDGQVVRNRETCELNPFDRPVIECALNLRDKHGGSITALTMGPEASAFTLYEAMAMGVDRAVLIVDPVLAGSDTLATSTALGAAVKHVGLGDLILFGVRTSDSDTGHVGPQTAVLLNIPIVTGIMETEVNKEAVTVKRQVDEFIELYETTLPAALTIHPRAFPPRDIPLQGIESASRSNAIKRLCITDLGIQSNQVGEGGSGTRLVSMNRVIRERNCEFISGSVEEQADELMKKLKGLGRI